MSEHSEPTIPPALRPQPGDVAYDLDRSLDAVLSLRTRIPDDAFTATILGTERAGHGVVIGERGLVLTIGYLVTEATEVWLVGNNGRAVQGDVVGYDYETGFGLVQALGKLDLPALSLGSARDLRLQQDVIIAGHGGRSHALKARLAAKREFAGYWEYVLDEALYTTPPHPNWGGAALLGADGRLCGIGSLYIDQVQPQIAGQDGNMSVPVDLLESVLPDLMRYGRSMKPPRPWLGMFVSEVDQQLAVAGVYDGAPAGRANLRTGDVILEVGGAPVTTLANLFRGVWAQGSAGTTVMLTVLREGRSIEVPVRSVDRATFWRTPDLH
ncbi:MAG: S1C family serine protease [Gammaproteobacteria bacterium]|jgi:S1-C subfamily serine protease|nr:S1C family serine protease [Gammaproteobacteria bacterium]